LRVLILEKLRSAFLRSRDGDAAQRRLEVTAEGARVWSAKSGRTVWQIRWDVLDEIVAFKADALVVDHICIGFRESDAPSFHVVDEETPGWNDLISELSRRFGVTFESWFESVAFPAFAENRTTLWLRGVARG
jgi:hypothetical protein